jgi:dipeptidase E
MKLLLTSAGVRNDTIKKALVELLGKPIAESNALCIPTGSWGHNSFAGAWRFIAGQSPLNMTNLGWQSLAVLELTALPTMNKEQWVPVVEEADVLLANGGDACYIAHHMWASGMDELIPKLDNVWVGLSAGSMVLTPRIGKDFMTWPPPDGSDRTLGIVDFSMFPHLDSPGLDENTMEGAEKWAAEIGNPSYAIDDDTAIRVVDGNVDIVTEGNWRRFD